MFLLDTNTLIYFFRRRGEVGKRLLATPPAQVAIPSICAYEIEVGIALSTNPAKRLAQWRELLDVVRILSFARA